MKFRKKPVVIEAVQFHEDNLNEVLSFIGTSNVEHTIINGVVENVTIRTLEGDMKADIDDWIIKGVKGEFYPCKPDIFLATYEPVIETTLTQLIDDVAKEIHEHGYGNV